MFESHASYIEHKWLFHYHYLESKGNRTIIEQDEDDTGDDGGAGKITYFVMPEVA